MLQCTKMLRDEHLCIRHMLDCLESLIADARRSGKLDSMAASELIFLFESFADGQHQEKEEQILFPHLLHAASSEDEEGIRQLLTDHANEQLLMQDLRTTLRAAIGGELPGIDEAADAAAAYVTQHREHMAHETAVLLPMAERILTPADDAEIAEGFRHVEALGAGTDGIFELVRGLCRKLGVEIEHADAS